MKFIVNTAFKLSIAFLLGGMLTSCEFVEFKSNSKEANLSSQKPLARVYDKYLYEEELSTIMNSTTGSEDSLMILDKFIHTWIRRQLMMREAESNVGIDKVELEKKLQDYKFALLVHEYEKKYSRMHLNTQVSDEEVQKYYEQNKDNFQLNRNIVKADLVQLPKDAPSLKKFRKDLKSNKEDDRKDIKNYCFLNATNYSLDENWIDFTELVKNTPWESLPNMVDFLKKHTFVETSNDEFIFFIRIKEYKITDQIAPLLLVEDQIRKIILNKRKVQLISNLEEEIYNRAIKNNEFEIF
ncbi:peptidyl-prolyl cis-trans isomerase [Aureibacter tunicatorum]|uniref:Peptidyl-prolyl cis-trans isomerase n=1 Tax=Aureibacter tunicatorum TaxID=866807 RepID=A0AAE3XP89_9BACT|nr:peptidyl-prolyl cis-trans isomerase [Aureibacter tunicatorum]MDR6240125.1 hypothetical protein [Aureibacter tunicatorum]BDD05994.1 hypothetical protein AUTU_34770 [Aureibacter tunicatorum]